MYEIFTQLDPISIEQTIQYGFLGGITAAATAAGGSGLGSALGGIASGIGSLFGIGRGRRQNKRNIQNMKMQYKLDKNMFDYQNAYNTPAQQMQRLKSAGLNPALMYGQGTTGNASGYPQTKPLPQYQETPVDTQPIMSGAIAAAQLKQIKTQTEGLKIDNLKNAGTRKSYIRQMILQNKQITQQTNKTKQEVKNLVQQKKLTKKQLELTASQKEKTDIDKALSQLDLDAYERNGLAPSDYGIIKGLFRAGVSLIDAIKLLLNMPDGNITEFFTGILDPRPDNTFKH